MIRVLKNAKVILPDHIMRGGIIIKDDIIEAVFEESPDCEGDEVIDCQGLYLSPGFIDLHVHGGGGADFMEGTEDAIQTVLRAHGNHGTTSMLPTTLSCSLDQVIHALQMIEIVQNNYICGPRILGAHLEGNFFSVEHKGAQDPEFIIPPTRENYLPIVSSVKNIKRISCAPEVENACGFAAEMSKQGILISVAHSNAKYEEFMKGIQAGFSHVTHLFNGMSSLSSPNYYCRAGVSECALLVDEARVEMIADGRHVPKELLRLVYKVKGASNINLCTDAMCAADMPEDGIYKLGALDTVIKDQVAVLASENTFAGSVCTTDRALRTMYRYAEIPLYEAVKMLTVTPARMIGEYYRLGSIEAGKLADINLFDDDIQVQFTMINGEVYKNLL